MPARRARYNETMKNGIFTLDWASVLDSILTAVVVAVVIAFAGVVTTSGFDVFTANWVVIGENMVNYGFVAGVGALLKAFASDNDGNLLGIGSSTPAPAQQ